MTDDDRDLIEAMVFLGGFTEYDKRGVPRHRYYKPDSPQDKHCREALARVLRSSQPLGRQLRDMLASAIDPEPNPTTFPSWSARELVFKKRGKGAPPDPGAKNHIADFIWQEAKAGKGVEKAVEAAQDRFNLSREAVYDIWGLYRPVFEKIFGPLK